MSIPANARSLVKTFYDRHGRCDLTAIDFVRYEACIYRRYQNCEIFRGPANRFSIIARHRVPPSAIAKAIERKMLDGIFAFGNS